MKSKSSIALLIGIILVLSLITVWYVRGGPWFIEPVPSVSPLILSDLENLNSTATMEGTVGKEGYFFVQALYGAWELPIIIKAHVYTTNVTEENIVLRIDVNITRADTNEMIPDLSGNSTYVVNKLTRENVEGAPEANKPRRGYDPFYPPRLKAGEDIHNVWLDNLNVTGTLEYKGIVIEEDVELYEYFVNKTITKELVISDLGDSPEKPGTYTLTSTKTVLVEPLSGIPVYTRNETFILVKNRTNPYTNQTELLKVVYLTYKDRAVDLATARLAHGAMQLLEFDKQVKGWILGVIVVILTVAFIFNTRSLTRKMSPQAKT